MGQKCENDPNGLYAPLPEGAPYNVLDGLKYGWADESDWPGIAPQGPFDEHGYTGGGFHLEAGAYTLKVDLSQSEWHWFGKLIVTRDGDDPEKSARSCWVRILSEDEGVR